MNKKILFIVCIILFPILIFAGSDQDEAMSLYFSGKDSYNSGNYYDAQRYFQSALIKNPDIEAKAPNIKYMLGVSAFNNNDYKTAKTYLTLFSDNPIANDLLNKITEYEATLPEDFLYHNNISNNIMPEATKSTLKPASATVDEEIATGGLNPLILVAAISVLIIAIGLFLEIKINTFSNLAVKLVGVSPDLLNNQQYININDHKEEISESPEEIQEEIEINDKALLDTPFDEEINIDEMASKDITELSKFFGDNEPIFDDLEEQEEEEIEIENISSDGFKNDDLEEFNDARSSILNSVLDTDEDESENLTQDIAEPSAKFESYTPKYEHLDNIPDDFDVNSAISKAYELIESVKPETESNGNDEQWVSIDEYSDSLDEGEKFNVNYFQNIEDMGQEDLDKYYDFIFSKHNKEKV